MTWEPTVDVTGPCWLAARCFGEYQPRYLHMDGHNLFAHTNALFVTVGGKRPSSAEDAGRFVREIDGLIEYAPRIPTDDLRTRALEEYRKAREYFAAMSK